MGEGGGWNDCRSDTPGDPSTDDVEFIGALIDEIAATCGTDPSARGLGLAITVPLSGQGVAHQDTRTLPLGCSMGKSLANTCSAAGPSASHEAGQVPAYALVRSRVWDTLPAAHHQVDTVARRSMR